jgi:CheY-like chemotaxis protein
LIVPSDLLTYELGETLLDRDSLAVRAARGAQEALTINTTWRPHLVVLRSRIDGRTVAALCRSLKQARPECPPRLLLLTDSIIPQGMNEAADTPCDAHLVSPVDTTQLLKTIAELLEVRQRRSSRAPIDSLVHTEGFAGERDAPVDAGLGTAINVSEDGMLLESSRPLAVGASGTLLFFLPGVSERIALRGIVRAAVDEVRLLFAIELIDLAPHHRKLIRRYVEITQKRR